MMFNKIMKSSAIVSLLLILFVYQVRGQTCPQGIEAAHMCVPGIYTSDRVFIDTTTFNTFLNNCTCSFTTTSNVLKLVTYMAPNYPQCNSAIRIETDSGNSMRFECLASGTYLDTSIHKSGQATFEKYSEYYDNNYCLMLEVASQPTDSITVTCTADIPLEYLETSTTQASNIDYAFNGVTTTTSEVFPVNDATTGYVPELTTLQQKNQSDVTLDNITEAFIPTSETPSVNTTDNNIYTTTTETVVEITTESKTNRKTTTESQLQTTEQAMEVQTNDTIMTVDPIDTNMATNGSAVADGINGQIATTSAGLERHTAAQLTSTSATTDTVSTALKNVMIESQSTVSTKIEVNNTMEDQTTTQNIVVDSRLDKHINTYVSMETMNFTNVNTSLNVEEYMSDTVPSLTENFVDTSSNSSSNADNYTISFDNLMRSSAINNEDNTTDNFTTATDVLSANVNVTEAINVVGDMQTNGTNIVTAMVTGTVLFNSSGDNTSKTIQTIDTVQQEILADDLSRIDPQLSQTTSKYDITFMSNLPDNLSTNKAIEFSSPSPTFNDNMETVPITPPTDISNSLIMIPKYAEVNENSTENFNNITNQTTDYALNFPGMDTLTESETANITFTNNVILETSPFTANEPRVVTENFEPILPIENITDGVFEKVQTNTEGFSFDAQNGQQNASTADPSIDANSTDIITSAPLLSNSNAANMFTMDTLSGFDSLQGSIFVTDQTPVNENGSTTTEDIKMSSTTVRTTQGVKYLQDPVPSESISSFDMHNNLHETVMPTFSKQLEVTNGGYQEVTSATTPTENYFPTNEGINEPFVNSVSTESTKSFNDVPSNSPETANQSSFVEPSNRIDISEHMNSNLSDSSMEQNVTGFAVVENPSENITTNESVTSDPISIVDPLKQIHISDYPKSDASNVEQNNTAFDVLGNPAETIATDGSKTSDQISIVEPSKSIHVSEYWTSNMPDASIEQNATGFDVLDSQMESATNSRSMATDKISIVEPSKRIHISDYLNSNVSDSSLEQNSTVFDVLGNPTETIITDGAKTSDHISLVEPSKSIHVSEYWNNNMSDSNLDQNLSDIGVQGNPLEDATTDKAMTADQISFVEPSKRIHVSEYLNSNLSDSNLEQNTTDIDVQGTNVYDKTMTADQISFVEPSKSIHVSEYLNSNMSDSNLEQNITDIDIQGSNVYDKAMTAEQISIVEPSKRFHVSEYMSNNFSDSNVELNVTSIDVQGDQIDTVTNAESFAADKISLVEPSRSIHESEYLNNELLDSNMENTTTNVLQVETMLEESENVSNTEQLGFVDPMLTTGAMPTVNEITFTTTSQVNKDDVTTVIESTTLGQKERSTWSPASAFDDAGVVPTGTSEMLPETSTAYTRARSSSVAANIDATATSITNKVLSTDSSNSGTVSEVTKETSTFSAESNVPPMPNIISEEIVPEQSIPNESVMPTVNTNYIDNIHASNAAEVFSGIESLTLNGNGGVTYHEASKHVADTATAVDNETHSNMIKSAVDILSEIEKQVITDAETFSPAIDGKVAIEQTTEGVVPTSGLESTSASVPTTGTDAITSPTSRQPTVPTGDLLEPIEVKHTDKLAKETQKPSTLPEIIAVTESAFDKVPTTPRRSFNVVEETMVVTESPRTVETGTSKVSNKEMNVSFDKESKGLQIDTNNNTYIIVVGIIAGLVVLATVIGIVCHNKRKRRSEKVNISGNGMDPASHQNRAYDSEAHDPEQGTSVVENDPESSPSNGEQNDLSSKAQEY